MSQYVCCLFVALDFIALCNSFAILENIVIKYHKTRIKVNFGKKCFWSCKNVLWYLNTLKVQKRSMHAKMVGMKIYGVMQCIEAI